MGHVGRPCQIFRAVAAVLSGRPRMFLRVFLWNLSSSCRDAFVGNVASRP